MHLVCAASERLLELTGLPRRTNVLVFRRLQYCSVTPEIDGGAKLLEIKLCPELTVANFVAKALKQVWHSAWYRR